VAHRRFAPVALLPLALLLAAPLSAQEGFAPPPHDASELTASIAAPARAPRIDETFRGSDPDAQRFHEHVMVLASPWMGGRLPGTRGMELASEYMEWNFRRSGLEPGFTDGSGAKSYRQPFRLGGKKSFNEATLVATPEGGASISFERDRDWKPVGLGEGGATESELVFVGYAIDNGPDGYATFAEGDSLEGRVALMLRFEPMTEEGRSRWADDGWSPRAGFAGKFRALAARKPAAVLVVNTPGATDPRVGNLDLGGQKLIDGVPVFALTADAADRLVRLSDPERGILDLRRRADEAGGIVPLPGPKVKVAAILEETPVIAENVVGVLPGRGALADEVIVIGGHLDHLGNGDFGSRSGERVLHPGADDNASGSAGVMMLADSLTRAYAAEPEGTPLRTVVFVGFSAEESGLNGSAHYVRQPIFPIERTVLMFNYDMIGRIENERLSVSGMTSGIGMEDWAKVHFTRREEVDGLKVIPGRGSGGGSDHASFLAAGVPVLFAIIADFHDDYHTPRDSHEKINSESGAKAVRLFHDMALDMAKRPERFAFNTESGPMRQRPLSVRIGMRSRPLGDEPGLEVIEVTPGGSAEEAGFVKGDRLLKWNKKEMNAREDLVAELRTHQPGDEVQAVVVRGGEEVTLFVRLKGTN